MCRKIMLLCDYAEQVKEYYDGKWWLSNEQLATESYFLRTTD